MNEDSVPAGRFLACVEFVKPDHINRFARLRPIYEVNEQVWRQIDNGESEFSDEGLVFWWNPLTVVTEGSLWVITLQPQHGYGTDSRHKDKFAVADAWWPYQAVTLKDVVSRMMFRRALASGQFLVDTPIVGRPLVKIPGEEGRWVILPESFRTAKHNEHILISVSGLEGVVPVYAIDNANFVSVDLGVKQYALLLDPGASVDYQCALSDAQLIEYMRKRISSIDRSVLDGLGVTKNILRNYLEKIESAGLGGEDAAKENARRDAVVTLVEHFEAEVTHLDKVVEVLVGYPSIQEELEDRSAREFEHLRVAKEQELSEENQAAIKHLSEKRKEIELATQELDILHSSIRGAVTDIVDSPLDALTRHGLLDTIRRSLQVGLVPLSRERITKPPKADIEVIKDVISLKKAVVAWCYNTGVDPYVMQASLAAILAYRVTLLAGANSERLAVALASTVAGGAAVRVSVNTAVFGIGDLMNSPINPIGSTYLEQNYTLGKYLAERTRSEPTVVILSGCNRAPPEVVLPEFLMTMEDEVRTISWLHDGTRVSSVALPSGLMVIGTLHSGNATYGIPSELSRQLAFVPSDHQEIEGFQLPSQSIPLASRIDHSLWSDLHLPFDGVDIDAFVGWLRVNGVVLPADVLTKILSTYLRVIDRQQSAIAEAIAGVLLGRDPGCDLKDIPGTDAEEISQRLNKLSISKTWREASRHFNLESDE
ncbi:MAG: hypothetical protein AB2784_08265 [Candidatus Thiodiazotropha endolucinida]